MKKENTQHTTKLTHSQCLKLVKEISKSLSCELNNISWSKYYTNYLNENIREEKDHLRFKPDGIISGITANQGGMFFSVKQIIEYFEQVEKVPDVKNYLFWRKSIYTAFSLVANYRKEIEKALSKNPQYKEVLKMDYCYLASHDKKGNELY